MPKKVVLYSFFKSSASWRVRIALAYKGIQYDYISVNITKDEQFEADYVKKNTQAQIPTLVIDEITLTQSLPIIEYLEETYPHNPLLPKDPAQRAQVRRIAEIINCGIQPLQNPLSVATKVAEMSGKEEHKTEWIKYWIEKGFEALEKVLETTAGNYCVGDSVTIADLCLVPQVANAIIFKVDMGNYPIISRLADTCNEHEAFKASHPSKQPDAPSVQDTKL